ILCDFSPAEGRSLNLLTAHGFGMAPPKESQRSKLHHLLRPESLDNTGNSAKVRRKRSTPKHNAHRCPGYEKRVRGIAAEGNGIDPAGEGSRSPPAGCAPTFGRKRVYGRDGEALPGDRRGRTASNNRPHSGSVVFVGSGSSACPAGRLGWFGE